jgi:hypothetical protein
MTKSLKQLEAIPDPTTGGEDWPSALVSTCKRLYEKPLQDFTIEDLRIMIGQEIGLEFLVPIALERLADNPFQQGDYYPGDLLMNLLRLPAGFWHKHPDLRWELAAIVQGTASTIETLLPEIKRFHDTFLPPRRYMVGQQGEQMVRRDPAPKDQPRR